MKIGQFAVDEQREQDGVWVDAGAGLRLKVARLNNTRYENYLRQIGKPLSRQVRHGTIDAETVEDLTKRAVAKHVLLGWENLDDDAGNPIPYSPEKALELLREYRDFYRMVVEIAQEASLFRAEDTREAEGNSGAVSTGS